MPISSCVGHENAKEPATRLYADRIDGHGVYCRDIDDDGDPFAGDLPQKCRVDFGHQHFGGLNQHSTWRGVEARFECHGGADRQWV